MVKNLINMARSKPARSSNDETQIAEEGLVSEDAELATRSNGEYGDACKKSEKEEMIEFTLGFIVGALVMWIGHTIIFGD